MIITVIYNLFLISAAILLLPVILIAFAIQPKFRAGFFEKIGFYAYDKSDKNTVVFHAVSVGETLAVKELVKQYAAKHPEERIIVTTTTKTGQELAKKTFTEYTVTYYPYDFFFSVLSFFNTYKPKKVVIAETEIWPCFVTIAKMLGIKVYTVNGRISPHSYNGYKKIKLFVAPILNKYEKILMQSEDDAKRIEDIGADSSRTVVAGNLKFDINKNLSQEQIDKYKNELKTGNYRIFIAASTHKGEDEIATEAFLKLKEKAPDAKLLIAPRHPERQADVYSLIEQTGLKCGKRSLQSNFDENDIIMLDTMGELAKLFSIGHTAFVGGSFSGTGGHNPLEPLIWEKPVISGPSVFNFKDVYKTVTDKKSTVIVNDKEEFTKELISFYTDSRKYDEYCNNAKSVFDENRGAINRILDII